MRFRGRVLAVVALAALLVALPGGGVANGSDPAGAGPTIKLPGGADAAQPAISLIAGATIGTVGSADLTTWSGAGGATIVDEPLANGYLFYNSAGGLVLAPLGLPAGATLWQVDVYGWALPAGSAQNWYMYDQDAAGGDLATARTLTIPSGSGIRTGTMSFAGGYTLAAGHNLQIGMASTTPSSGFDGVVFQYTMPTYSFVPITPTRVLDTRTGTGGLSGPFTNHVARTFQVTGGSTGVPAGARAVTGNLTVTGQTSNGYLFIGPVAMNNPTSSTLNFPAGDDRANAVTVGLSSLGTLSITFVAPTTGPTTQAIFDVTGYYM
ncbi:MAG: hypothetical protein ACXWNR_03490 [Candidatus Limnocylindrales bacterium]